VKVANNILSGGGTIRELLQFLWTQKLWWLIPFVLTLLVVGMLVLAAQVSGISPFIYTLF
jgi:uncharacterized membrane protein